METEYLRIFQPVWEMAVNGEDSQHRSTVQQKATVGSDQTGRGIAKAGKAMPNSLLLMSADADTAGVAGISAEDAVSEKENLHRNLIIPKRMVKCNGCRSENIQKEVVERIW
jgi:hypothetical protein